MNDVPANNSCYLPNARDVGIRQAELLFEGAERLALSPTVRKQMMNTGTSLLCTLVDNVPIDPDTAKKLTALAEKVGTPPVKSTLLAKLRDALPSGAIAENATPIAYGGAHPGDGDPTSGLSVGKPAPELSGVIPS